MSNLLNTEPAVLIGAVGALISAGIPLLAKTFGWTDDLAAEWEAFLLAAWSVLSIFVTAMVIRAKVYSPATHDADVDTALHETPPQ